MIPFELKRDKDGLLYLEDDNVFKKGSLNLDKRFDIDEYYQNYFYPIDSTDEYIIKYRSTEYTRKEIKNVKEMLINLIDKQKNIKSVDFPIAYFSYMKRLSGLIIKYYKDSISCDHITNSEDIECLGKYYYHDEDSVHNLFLLFNELLDVIYELIDNGVCFTDLNPGNILISDNSVKLIDFDYKYVYFTKNDLEINYVMYGYYMFIREMLKSFNLECLLDYYKGYNESKTFLKKLENKVRKG